MDLELNGLDELTEKFNKVQEKAPEKIRLKTNRLTREVKMASMEKTPVLTGELKKGWHMKMAKREGDAWQGTVYNDKPHSHLIEDGHRIVRPKGNLIGWVDGFHMLKSTVDEMNQNLQKDLEDWIPEVYEELNT